MTKPNLETEKLQLEVLFSQGFSLRDRVIIMTGEIDDTWFKRIDCCLLELENRSQEPVILRLSSEGGSSTEALACIGRLVASPCDILIEGYGRVESAATLILASGNLRRLSKFSTFMHHASSYTVEGRHTEAKAYVAQQEREERLWSEWMAGFSKKDAAFWYKMGAHVDAYFTPEQLLEYGVIDEIF